MKIFDLLRSMKEYDASDLYLKVGLLPSIRVFGQIKRITNAEPVTDEQIENAVRELLNEHQLKCFHERPDLDVAYNLDGNLRFRINLFRQQGHIGLVARLIHDTDLTFESLNLPDSIVQLSELPRGLVIVAGATGSGKSTTLAAMVDHINSKFARHIMTIEDPIEYIHTDKRSVINQREVGYDTQNFKDALRHVVRQSPDVILIGEMRDMDTMMTAISAAETGHLVLTTLHTMDVSHTLDRIINHFPEYLRPQIRHELSICLEGIVCMRLLSKRDGSGRIPSMEILRSTSSTRKALTEGANHRLKELMQKGEDLGMRTFNQSLLNLYHAERISYDEALMASSNPEEFRLNAQGLFTGTDSLNR